MSNEVMYAPLKALHAEGTFVTNWNSNEMPYSELLPQHIRQGTVVLAIEEGTNEDEELFRTASAHQRVHEISTDFPDGACFVDEFGNIFSLRITQKGADFTQPHLFETTTSNWDYDVYGVQMGGVLGRAIRSSKLMREAGIDTEMIIGATELQEFYWKGEMVDRSTFDENLVASLDTTDEKRRQLLDELTKRPWLHVTYRLMAVPERFADLFAPKSNNDVAQLRHNILTAVNNYEQHKAKQNPEYIPQQFDPNSEEDIVRYITEYVPQNLGSNVGRMHGIGLYHRYLHLGNITGLGGIVDLDSVRGKALGFPNDTAISAQDISNDLSNVLTQFRRLLYDEDKLKKIRFKYLDETAPDSFKKSFLGSYFKTLLEQHTFSYKFIPTFNYSKDILLEYDSENGTHITEQIEQIIKEKYEQYVPQIEDLIQADTLLVTDVHEIMPNPDLVVKKDALLKELVSLWVMRTYKEQADFSDDPRERIVFYEALSRDAVARHKNETNKHFHAYIYSAFRAALSDNHQAFLALPYLGYFEESLLRSDEILGTNVTADLHQQFDGVIPNPEVRAAVRRYIINADLGDSDLPDLLQEFLNPEINLDKLTNNQLEKLEKLQHEIIERIRTWTNSRLVNDGVPDELYEKTKLNYTEFLKTYFMVVFELHKPEVLVQFARDLIANSQSVQSENDN